MEVIKCVLVVKEITQDQIRKEGREYNAYEWDKIIDRFYKYKGCKFYIATPQNGYDYERYFAIYEIPEGLILFHQISYHSSLSNNGFCRIVINADGIVSRVLLKDINGKEGYCTNNKQNRKILAKSSQIFGAIFSNDF